ncbi:MAG: right-handed parallel beta-helix repeat-containing protein [Deltaproteobacteria bacterium]|nr:right-handed parallel beta-helix repeat-containing protein [Deltaproteobacteria bacterium]
MLIDHCLMWWRFVLVSVALAFGCTKPNPLSCADGTCTDPTLPFCDVNGEVEGQAGTCIAVACEPGTFQACRGDLAITCNIAGSDFDLLQCARGCDDALGGCNACTAHAQCPSRICKPDGACAAENEITYAEAAGASVSDCTVDSPCTLERALELPAPSAGQFILVGAGVHQSARPYLITGRRTIVGVDAVQTVVKGLVAGSVVLIEAGATVSLEQVQITGGIFDGTIGDGKGVECPLMPLGPRVLRVVDAAISDNEEHGLFANGCTVDLLRSRFERNGFAGAEINIGNVIVDRCSFSSNGQAGLHVAPSSDVTVTNSLMYRNATGAFLFPGTNSTIFDFNTIVDNGVGLDCASAQPANNLIARNDTNTTGTAGGPACTHPGSLITADIAPIKFKSPDVEPFDYHLSAGSTAIDAALDSSLDHDFDGEPRPSAASRDIGADEAH